MALVNPRHIELEKYSQDLQKQGKWLFKENPEENAELMKFHIILFDEILWRHRDEFALMMENFLNGLIQTEEFETKFSLLFEKTRKEFKTYQDDLEKLKKLNLDPKSSESKFGARMTLIFRQFEVLEDEECNEQDLKEYVKNIFLLIQPYL